MGWKKSLYYTYIFTMQNILRLKYFFIHSIFAQQMSTLDPTRATFYSFI